MKIIPASILEPEEEEEQDGDDEEATSGCTEETTPKGENGKENPTNDETISAEDTEDKTSSDNDESALKDNQVKTNANLEDEKSADDQTAVQKRVDAAPGMFSVKHRYSDAPMKLLFSFTKVGGIAPAFPE